MYHTTVKAENKTIVTDQSVDTFIQLSQSSLLGEGAKSGQAEKCSDARLI